MLEVLLKLLISDLNRLLDVKNKSNGTEVKKQRSLFLSILLESNYDLEMDYTKAQKVFIHFLRSISIYPGDV
jgi:hypothetical protein